MNFVDTVLVSVKAGDGGNGAVSFRHEKFVDRGGPDGGDGGRGGDVIFRASRNQNTLTAFRYQRELRAGHGQAGSKRRKHGKNGTDLYVDVPVGTVIALYGDSAEHEDQGEHDRQADHHVGRGEGGRSPRQNRILADLTADGQTAVIAKGGRGGFGNAHFISSVRQAPKFAEKGELGEAFLLRLEIKMIADAGLVGLPNAGKSTFLATVSNARPEIADYPFTTVKPNLGVVDIDKDTSVLIADIPGLIEGAAQGKGLGHEFLRHVERTKVLIHLIDAYQEDVAATYLTIQEELRAYKADRVDLTGRPQIVALNKTDGLDREIIDDLVRQLQTVVPAGTAIHAISARSGEGVQQLLYAVKTALADYRSAQLVQESDARQKAEAEHMTQMVGMPGQAGQTATVSIIPILRLTNDNLAWRVSKTDEGFLVTGQKIEKFAARTDFSNEQALQRLREIMRKMGIMHELQRQGVEVGRAVRIGGHGLFVY